MATPDRELQYRVPPDDSADKPADVPLTPGLDVGVDSDKKEGITSTGFAQFDQVEAGPSNPDDEPEKPDCCLSPIMTLFKRLINLINAPLAVVSLALDIVYLVQVPFHVPALYKAGLLLLVGKALLSCFVMYFYYNKYLRKYTIKPDQQTHGSADSEDDLKSMGNKIYSSVLPLIFFGSFRLLSSTDFGNILLSGYSIEAFTSIVPMTFILIFNNYETTELSVLQSATVGLKCLLVLLFLPEVFMMIFEILRQKQLQHAKVLEYQKPTEEQRRQKNQKRVPCFVIFSMILFIAVLSSGLVFGTVRTCGDRQVLDGAVCATCTDSYCLSCDDGPHFCTECEKGYYPNSQGVCVDCDNSDSETKCLTCTGDDEGFHTTCTECGSGYRLEDGRCAACGESGKCAVCTEDGCQRCKDGFWLDDSGACVACSDTLSLCSKCNGPDRCTVCLPAAGIDERGKCSRCSEHIGWTKQFGGDGCTCKNDLFMSVYQGYKCLTCGDYIEGCKTCETKKTSGGNKLYVDLGTDSELSKFKEDPNILVCKECGHNMFQNTATGDCELCSSRVDRCHRCSADGSACLECNEGAYRYGDKLCLSCEQTFGEGCERCDRDVCHSCRGGFSLVFGICFKNLFNW